MFAQQLHTINFEIQSASNKGNYPLCGYNLYSVDKGVTVCSMFYAIMKPATAMPCLPLTEAIKGDINAF